MRTISLNFRQAVLAQESGEIAVLLLTVTHPDADAPIYLSTDPTQRLTTDPLIYGTRSRSQDFIFLPMEAQLPDEQDGTPPQSKLVVYDVNGSLIPLLRSVISPPKVKMEAILASDPDTVEFEVPALDIVNADYGAGRIEFQLSLDVLANEGFPGMHFDPSTVPGLFT